jgi:hypothetical protein
MPQITSTTATEHKHRDREPIIGFIERSTSNSAHARGRRTATDFDSTIICIKLASQQPMLPTCEPA